MSPRRRNLIVAALGAFVIGGFALSISLLREEPLAARQAPVVLVHGYGSSSDAMSVLEEALQAEGFDVVAIDLPANGQGDFEDSARALAEAVEATGASRVDLVGFSAGGVVVRTYLKHLDGTARARRVITLGSPNHGTQLAGLAALIGPDACVDACAQMLPDSSFLNELNSDDESPGDVTYTSVWTDFDEAVRPPDSAELEGAHNVRVQDICAGARLGHGDLIRDPVAIGLVLHALAENDAADATDCSSLRALGREALSS